MPKRQRGRRLGPRMREKRTTPDHFEALLTQVVLHPPLRRKTIEIVSRSLEGKRERPMQITTCIKIVDTLRDPAFIEPLMTAYRRATNPSVKGSILHCFEECGFTKTRRVQEFMGEVLAKTNPHSFLHGMAKRMIRHH